MVSRRSFLLASGAIALGPYLQSCSQGQDRLTIDLLKGSLPQQLIKDFAREFDAQSQISFKSRPTLQTIRDLLTATPSGPLDLFTLSHFDLTDVRQQKLIQPLDLAQSQYWEMIPSPWHQLVTQEDQVWGAPYRYGYTAIAYRSDKFRDRDLDFPQDWSDLWRPELKNQISLLDQPREIIGLTLKKLGYSYNTEDLISIKELEPELIKLHQQTKFYGSNNYLQSLVLGDNMAAVGWSSDILPLVTRYPYIKMVVPSTGTALWADLWVRYINSSPDYDGLIQQWLDFCWAEPSAKKISLFTAGISPVLAEIKVQNLPNNLNNNPWLDRDQVLFNRSDFILPLPPEINAQYLDLWQRVRTTPL
jgi:putative spermidine/putrescine transport system substrate-binding protein